MNDNEAIDKLIEETEIDPDSLAIERCTKEILDVCTRRNWPVGCLAIVRRNSNMVSAFGAIHLKRCEETVDMLASAGDHGLKLALIIKLLGDD
jgi:hypothetical protein